MKKKTKIAEQNSGFAQRFWEMLRENELHKSTRDQIGKKIGVTGTAVTYWLNGNRLPTLKQSVAISHTLGCQVQWLIAGDGDKYVPEHAINYSLSHLPVQFISHDFLFDQNNSLPKYCLSNTPLYIDKSWFKIKNYRSECIVACVVSDSAMEPTLFKNDIILINLDEPNLADGVVLAICYEGQLISRRILRDNAEWYLQCDNADKIRYPNKIYSEQTCQIIGKIVSRQSDII